MNLETINTLRVNIKSLAAESKIIKNEIRRVNRKETKDKLHLHRIFKVRTEARSAQLALAAARNIPYEIVELNAKTEPNWNRIKEKFLFHACIPYSETSKRAMKELIDRWIEHGKQYYKRIN